MQNERARLAYTGGARRTDPMAPVGGGRYGEGGPRWGSARGPSAAVCRAQHHIEIWCDGSAHGLRDERLSVARKHGLGKGHCATGHSAATRSPGCSHQYRKNRAELANDTCVRAALPRAIGADRRRPSARHGAHRGQAGVGRRLWPRKPDPQPPTQQLLRPTPVSYFHTGQFTSF